MKLKEDIRLCSILLSDLPFGVVYNEERLLFTVAAEEAGICEVLLYKKDSIQADAVIQMENMNGCIFQAEFDNTELQAVSYLFRADGMIFLDPYAKSITGRDIFGRMPDKGNADQSEDIRCGLAGQDFDWEEDKLVSYPWQDTILYKLHVRGFTKMADVRMGLRGTYLGLSEMAGYFTELGVTTLLLMPCVEFNEMIPLHHTQYGEPQTKAYFSKNPPEDVLHAYRVNYWGYTEECSYFAPKASYASQPSDALREFKQMVKLLHRQGIEVLMEIEFPSKISQGFLLDCLKYWTYAYHIDGFKINSALDAKAVVSEPWLSKSKLIMPYFQDDVYQMDIGKTNGRLAVYHEDFLYTARSFLKGDDNKTAAFIQKAANGFTSSGIVNYIADNNGFTLADLYAYEEKHNEANGEDNRDGKDYNLSWNCGIEGRTKKKEVAAMRLKMRKNAIAALFLSQGTPMLLAGDEFGNSQNGNNNAYCQDNSIGWIDWKAKKNQEAYFQFVKQIIAFRKQQELLHFPKEFRKMDYLSCGMPDVTFHGKRAWYPDYSGQSRALGILLCGKYAKHQGGDIYIVYNMHWEAHVFDLPDMKSGTNWELIFTTADTENQTGLEQKPADSKGQAMRQYQMLPRSIAVFANSYKE